MSTDEERLIKDKKLNLIIPLCAKGNIYADHFLRDIAFSARIIDDFVDQDRHLSNDTVFELFYILLYKLPNNPFYKQHLPILSGVVLTAYNAWIDASKWEKSNDDKKKHYAFVLREFIIELYPIVAMLTGGYAYMREISLKIRETFILEEKEA